MEFVVKYESVPHFCFICGHNGHARRECPDEDWYEEGERFGIKLRTCPFKRGASRFLSFHATSSPVKRGLNFSGEQKDWVFSHLSSSSLNANRQSQTPQQRVSPADLRGTNRAAGGVGSTAKAAISSVVADVLTRGMQKMALGKRPRTANSPATSLGSGDGMVAQKVSGLNSCNGSSEASLGSGLSAPISVQDRLRTAKAKVTGSQMDHKQVVKKSTASKGRR
jgi:hypothetical protein